MGLRILWSSNALWANTGYGVQAKSVLPRLQKAGHEVAQFAWYGLQGAMIHAGNMPIYPVGNHLYGADIIGDHVRHFKADLVISLQDIWVLPDDYAERCRPARWACWFPIDMQPVPPRVAELARKADYPITYSKFGLTEAVQADIPNALYIPHGVETSVYQPGDKAAAKQRMGVPDDAFLVSMVAANKGQPSRKGFPENLLAFGRFHKRHPNSLLYLHTCETTAEGGVDFARLIPACGIPVEAVRFVDQYRYRTGLPPEYLAAVYQASDVLLAASTSEGFGIPIIEAQACGCPVVTTDWTSMPELTLNGYSVAPAQPLWTPLNSWAAVPSVDGIAEALEQVFMWSPAEREAGAVAGVEWVRSEYDWDVLVSQYWLPFLAQVSPLAR